MICEKFRRRFPYDVNEYYIVFIVFCRILKTNLLEMLNCLKQDMGIDYDGIGYYLPSIFESKDEQGYFDDGIMFYLNENEEMKINFKMFIKCLRTACEVYVEEHLSEYKKVKRDFLLIEERISKFYK